MGIASMLTAATSCQFDDTDIWNEMEQIKDRIETLEEAVIKTNEDIVALQAIVNALQKSVYVLAEVGFVATWRGCQSTLQLPLLG